MRTFVDTGQIQLVLLVTCNSQPKQDERSMRVKSGPHCRHRRGPGILNIIGCKSKPNQVEILMRGRTIADTGEVQVVTAQLGL